MNIAAIIAINEVRLILENNVKGLTTRPLKSGKGVKVASPPAPLQGERGVICFAGVLHFGIIHASQSLFSTDI